MAKKTSKKKVVKKAVKKTTKGKTAKKVAKKAVKKKVTVKKVSSKKAKSKTRSRKSKLVVMKMSKEELQYFQNLLLLKRAEILGDVDSMENETLRKNNGNSGGEISNMPIHMADIGTDNYEQEFALGLLDSERKIIKEIDAALKRISEGTYGICEGTGNVINRSRLEANPWARYCIEYATLIEKGLVVEGEEPEDYDEDDYDEDIYDDEDYDEDEDDKDDDYDPYYGVDEDDDDDKDSMFFE